MKKCNKEMKRKRKNWKEVHSKVKVISKQDSKTVQKLKLEKKMKMRKRKTLEKRENYAWGAYTTHVYVTS